MVRLRKNLNAAPDMVLTFDAEASSSLGVLRVEKLGLGMSKQYRRLMTVADAAGYVLAAPDDAEPVVQKGHVETTFRNGHIQAAKTAARKAAAASSLAPLSPSRALTTTTTPPSHTATSWLHTALALVRPKGVAA